MNKMLTCCKRTLSTLQKAGIEIVAKSTKLGAITNQFKGSLDEFSSDLKGEIKTIEHAVLSINDWEGELYNGFREKFENNLKNLKQLATQSDVISSKLERAIAKYDYIIDKLTKASH